MSLATQISNLAVRIGTEFKAVRSEVAALVGSKSSLTTTDKTSIVAAINEVKASMPAAGASINDATTVTTSAWSSSKTNTVINSATAQVKSDLLGGAGAAYDTLQELKGLLDASDTADDAALAALVTADGNRLRFDAAQTLTAGQKTQGQANLDVYSKAEIGDIATDFVATLNAALV